MGTYYTPKEAAKVYDKATVRLKGPNAITNFPSIIKTESIATAGQSPLETCSLPNVTASSLTSVFRYSEEAHFDGFGYCNVDAFKFGFDLPLTLLDIFSNKL